MQPHWGRGGVCALVECDAKRVAWHDRFESKGFVHVTVDVLLAWVVTNPCSGAALHLLHIHWELRLYCPRRKGPSTSVVSAMLSVISV